MDDKAEAEQKMAADKYSHFLPLISCFHMLVLILHFNSLLFNRPFIHLARGLVALFVTLSLIGCLVSIKTAKMT